MTTIQLEAVDQFCDVHRLRFEHDRFAPVLVFTNLNTRGQVWVGIIAIMRWYWRAR